MDRLIKQLQACRTQRGLAARNERLRVLKRARRKSPHAPAAMIAWHNELLFLAAYPDNSEILRRTEDALRSIGDMTAPLMQRAATRRALRQSGIAGTDVDCLFSLDIARWLAKRYPRDADVIIDDDAIEKLNDFLHTLITRTEADGLLTDDIETSDWLRAARGRATNLQWLTDSLSRLPCPNAVRDRLFDSLELTLRWRLRDHAAARTGARFPPCPPMFHDDELLRSVRLPDILQQPLPTTRPLPHRDARRMIDLARATLAVRQRETDPVTFADENDVFLLRLERGVDVAIFGMSPERRLPIESYFGYIAAKNRIPVGYGGGWVFGGRCEVGVNIFDEFRGGESAFVFAQVLRVYRQLFRATQLRVDPYQFGADNPEAIRSGAFWFYYRLGFRPTEPTLAELAERDAWRIASDRSFRSSTTTLRKLAAGTLALTVGSHHEAPCELPRLGYAVTQTIGQRHGGDRTAAERDAVARVSRAIGRPSPRAAESERRAFEQLCPLVDMIDGLTRWPAGDRRTLLAMMLAKGGPCERNYALAVQDHPRFLRAMHDLASAVAFGKSE